MKGFGKITFALLLFLGSFGLSAQESNESNEINENTAAGGQPVESTVLDGAYEKIGVKERIALDYDHIREADVLWSKRLWRVIDTREKINTPFVYEQQPFITILMDMISQNDDIPLFADDAFLEPITFQDLSARLNNSDTIEVLDPDTYEYVQTVVQNDFDPSSIQKFRLKEDWIFDEETSTMICRIIGIAPIRDVIDDNDNYRGQEVLFWVHYPSIRQNLVRFAAYNPFNDNDIMTWEDIFEMRLFSSYVMKESNAKNERIRERFDGRDALLESEKIQLEVFKKEHDLWSY